MQIPEELERIFRETPELAESYLVGGCVRDALLGAPQKDFDIEVFGVNYETLARALSRWGRTDLVGRSFGVVKLTTGSGRDFDFSLPRRDSKMGPGHKGFTIHFDPGITPRDAAARRDFTINALMWNPRTREVLDFFGGSADLRAGVLRHVGPAFAEDPLRVLRGLQFAGRFGLRAAPETIEFCRSIKEGYRELAVERVREEWFKWAARSVTPSAGLQFLARTEWIEHFPEIQALVGCPQDPEWHPEGDVFVHTGHCCDALAGLPEWREADEETRTVLMLAVLSHDFAKPATTHEAEKDGRRRIVSPGHEEAGGPWAAQFLERIQAPIAVRERVIPLVTNHLAHLQALNDRAVRRLARRLAPETIEHLCVVMTADQFGRPPMPRVIPESILNLRARAGQMELQAAAPKPLMLGRHLIALGLHPGAEFGRVLDAAFEAQIDGAFQDVAGGFRWLEDHGGLAVSPAAMARARAEFLECDGEKEKDREKEKS
jgi:tRNA nucleotidyltransferase (CCA-adding enzyme)